MLWYVIQTYTGKEERLVEMIRRILPKGLYGTCFVVYHEQLRTRGHDNQVHVERVFPGYAFISSNDPNNLFLHLKQVPAMSKMMAMGEFFFTPLEPPEAEFLEGIMDADHVIRLSYVATDGRDHVSYLSGPLATCKDRIQSYHFRKRYASVRLRISDQEKEVRMGIILNDDIRREVLYGKVEAPIKVPDRYETELVRQQKRTASGRNSSHDLGKNSDRNSSQSLGKNLDRNLNQNLGQGPDRDLDQSLDDQDLGRISLSLEPGDTVIVISGAFEGMPAVVHQTKKNAVKIGVHIFGQNITAEVPIESVRKTAS